MNKKSLVFLISCMIVCLIPTAGMIFAPTTETTENKEMAEFPSITMEDGSLNSDFFRGLETYINEHIALRNPMVYLDAMIQSNVFGVSNVDGVIKGTDGWLYYTATKDDYLGSAVLSERNLYNIAHNVKVIQDYLDTKKIDFVFVIPPNKNTLYGSNMPYYDSCVVNSDHSAKLLQTDFAKLNVRYLDLFDMFEKQDEVLYLKRDSHWNNKGALLVYNAIMDRFKLAHEDYSTKEPQRIKTDGDLNRMLYSFYGVAEDDLAYPFAGSYIYANEVESVEDGWIITKSDKGSKKLLMFRDSFANTLIPFFSEEFAEAYYSKGVPNQLEMYIDQYSPDYVVLEKVERNITDYLANPPIITGTITDMPKKYTIAATATTLEAATSENNADYIMITGVVDPARIRDDSDILVSVDGICYNAFQTENNSFVLYVKRDKLKNASVRVEVYVKNGDEITNALITDMKVPEVNE